MSFIKRWMKKDTGPKITNEAKRIYYIAEFQALGDVTKDGHINLEEFMRLLMLLGFPGGRDGSKRMWKYAGKTPGAKMNQDEYVALMFDKKIETKTNQWRTLFAEFDTDGTGWATKAEVIKGLEKMGLGEGPQLKQVVEKMDMDNDSRVSYTEFLKVQLHQR